MKEYAFFPGCAIASRYPFYEFLVTKILNSFGYSLKYPESVTCCPEPVSMPILNEAAWYAIGARNLAIAEQMGLDLLSGCPGCINTFLRINNTLCSDEFLKGNVNNLLKQIDRKFEGTIKAWSLLRVLFEEIGPTTISEKVSRPLHGLKAAIHYGCHSFEELGEYDDLENPQSLYELSKAIGIDVVSYPSEKVCCLSFANPIDRDYVLDILYEKIQDMKKSGANCILLMCPTCHWQIDMGQIVIEIEEEKYGELEPLPVFFYPQLLGIAMGMSSSDVGLQDHEVESTDLLESIGIS
jgi:heterodisulfide reductase subunit B